MNVDWRSQVKNYVSRIVAAVCVVAAASGLGGWILHGMFDPKPAELELAKIETVSVTVVSREKATESLYSLGATAGDIIFCSGPGGSVVYVVCASNTDPFPSEVNDGSGCKLWTGNVGEVVRKTQDPARYAELSEQFIQQVEGSKVYSY